VVLPEAAADLEVPREWRETINGKLLEQFEKRQAILEIHKKTLLAGEHGPSMWKSPVGYLQMGRSPPSSERAI
jgi:hypothetical protein